MAAVHAHPTGASLEPVCTPPAPHQGFASVTVTAGASLEPACTRAYRDNDRLRGCEPVLDGFRDESKQTALVLHRMSDGALQKLTEYVSRRLQKQNDPADVVTRILIVALAVSSAFGGTVNRYLQRDYKERMKQFSSIFDGVMLGKFMGGRPIGQKMHGAGISRHRALAMKVICEDLQVCKLALHRASEGCGNNRDYNVVDLEGSKYVVDLMVEPGALYPWKAFKAVAYIDGIQEVKEEPGSPERRVIRGAKFMGEGGEDEILQYLRSDTSDVEIARPSWHIESHNIQRESNEAVASGGFGTVYKADLLGKPVAEKRLALKGRTIDSQHVLDFVVEVALMRNLRHPNVLECIGGCVVLDARPRAMMLLTPWMPNGSLREAIVLEKVKKSHHFSLAQGMARGLGYLHSRGIVHCDFKSLNVLLDQDMVPCIGDFGMARLEGLMEQRIDSGACNGTPAWEAPEQVKRRYSKNDVGYLPASWKHVEVTHKADVYAFGLVIWEMHNQAIPDLDPRSKLQGLLPQIPEGVSWGPLVCSCCAGLPEDRPDMEKVVHDLCESERASLKQKIVCLQAQLKQEHLKNKDLSTTIKVVARQAQQQALQKQAEQQAQQLEHQKNKDLSTCAQQKIRMKDEAREGSAADPMDAQLSDPISQAATDLHRCPGSEIPKASLKRSAPQTKSKANIQPKRAKVATDLDADRRSAPHTKIVATDLDPAIIEAMPAVDSNDTRQTGTRACPEECGFGRNRICSIRKNATHTSYIMLIFGSDASTRQQLCQLRDKQCRGHSMPWINFILHQTVLRKLSREQVLALRQTILNQFDDPEPI